MRSTSLSTPRGPRRPALQQRRRKKGEATGERGWVTGLVPVTCSIISWCKKRHLLMASDPTHSQTAPPAPAHLAVVAAALLGLLAFALPNGSHRASAADLSVVGRRLHRLKLYSTVARAILQLIKGPHCQIAPHTNHFSMEFPATNS